MVAPLQDAISFADVHRGTNEWYNVASTVRRAIAACTDHITEQASLIRQLDERLRDRAIQHHEVQELHDELNRKADSMNLHVQERKVGNMEKSVSEAMGMLEQLQSEVLGMQEASGKHASKLEQQFAEKLHRMESKIEIQMEQRMEALEDAMERRLASKLEARQMEEYTARVTSVFDRAVASNSETALKQLETHAVRLTRQVEEVAASKADAADLVALRKKVTADISGALAGVREDVEDLREGVRGASKSKTLEGRVGRVEAALEAAQESAAAAATIAEEAGETAARRADRSTAPVRADVERLRSDLEAAQLEIRSMHALLFGGEGGGKDGDAPSVAGTPPPHSAGHFAHATPTRTPHSAAQGGGVSAYASPAPPYSAGGKGMVHVGSPGGGALGTPGAGGGVLMQVAMVGAHLSQLEGHVERNTAGLRSLTGNQAELMSMTYRRVDEHAAAIQKLSAGIAAGMEDRPTAAAVQATVDEGASRAERRAEAVATPLRERVMQLEVAQGLHEAEARKEERGFEHASKDARRRLEALEQRVAAVEGEQQVVVASSRALAGKVSGMLQQDVLTATAAMADDHGRRLAALEASLKGLGARVADAGEAGLRALGGRVAAIEDAASRAADGALRQSSSVQHVVAELALLREDQQRLAALAEVASAPRLREEARGVVREELRAREEKDEVRWQVLLERCAGMAGSGAAAAQAEEAAIRARAQVAGKLEVGELPRHLELLGIANRGYVDERCMEVEGQWGELLRGVEAALTARADRMLERVEAAADGDTRRVAGELWKIVERKADRSEVDSLRAEVRGKVSHGDLEAALDRKVDVRAFLATSH